ncbi:MAG: hypothetical protein CFK52_06185 [Chloracidobacterium sp. CP2_5A]|nr:MAG: hypothetical protein CFK52_06185 [Chloracidobacterium sp. CP2_5A]
MPNRALQELNIGRDAACQAHCDPARDDLVGRHHAKISLDGVNPPIFALQDFGSRNGAYANRRRVPPRRGCFSDAATHQDAGACRGDCRGCPPAAGFRAKAARAL